MKLESWHSSEDKRRWKIVRTDNYTDVPGEIVTADETTGECSLHVAGETKTFPNMTGLVHVSGVIDPAATAATMRDPHRVLIDASDRIGNVEQLRALRAVGYAGPASFEPFAASVHASASIESDLRTSLAYLKKAMGEA